MPGKKLAARGDRIVSKATLAKQQRDLAAVAHTAIKQYIVLVRRAVAHTTITAAAPNTPDDQTNTPDDLGPDVDLNGLNQSVHWPSILKATILPQIHKVTVAIGPQKHLTPSVATSINSWRAQWMAQRTQRLLGVPDQITKQIRDAIQADADENGPNPRSAASIVKDLLNPDAPTWKNRAMTIARTEVVSANNQGGLASWTAVHQSLGPVGGQVFKTWLATSDTRTRPDHAEVDGTEIPIDQTFTVGGQQMNGPGDQGADADEVIQCRCTLTFRVDDGTDSGDDLDQAADADTDDADVDDSLTAAAGAPNTGVAIMLGLGPTSEQECAADGVETEPPGLHCTVGYLSEPAASYTPEQQEALVDALGKLAPEGTTAAFATAHFNPNDPERQPCAVLLVQSDWLASFHDQVEAAITASGLEQATTFPIWIPHIAIAYNADPSVIPPAAVGSEIQFNRLVIGWGDQQIVAAGDGAAAPEAAPAATAPPEAPVTAAAPPVAPPVAGPPQPADGTPSEAAPSAPAGAMQWSGVLMLLDSATSDGRLFQSSGFSLRNLPLPLSYQSEGEHGGEMPGTTVIVGRILTASVSGNQLIGTGDFFDPMVNLAPTDAIQQVAGGIGFVSANMAVQVVSYLAPGPDGTLIPIDPMQYLGDPMEIVQVADQSEFAGATIVGFPAFADARIELVTDPSMPNFAPVVADAASPQGPVLTADSITFGDGTVVKVGDQVNIVDATGSDAPTTGLVESIDSATNAVTVAVEDVANPGQTNTVTVDASNVAVMGSLTSDDAATAASGAPPVGGTGTPDGLTAAIAFPGLEAEHTYPAEWFSLPDLDEIERRPHINVTADGRVQGLLAQSGTCHIGYMGECVAPPTSPTEYAYFHVGEVKTDEGFLACGKLTVGGGHADMKLGWRGTVEHYDNAGAAGAVVRAYDTEIGVVLAGALLPQSTPEQIAALRRNDCSGDWRSIGGHRELVAALSVNTGGFPLTPRAALAADGRPAALVAAGVVHGATGNHDLAVTLPSGTKISADDMTVLAGAFADVIDARTQAAADRDQRTRDARALRLKLTRDRLHLVS